MKCKLEINRKRKERYSILSESLSCCVAKWSTGPPVLCKFGSSAVVEIKSLQWIVFLPLKLVQHFVSEPNPRCCAIPVENQQYTPALRHPLKLWADSSGGCSDGFMTSLHSDYGYERHSNNQCIPAFWFSPSSLSKDCNVGQNYWNSTG